MEKSCEICKRKYGEMTHIIFIPEKEVIGFPHILGYHLGVCLECNLSYMFQYYGMSNKEVNFYINWIYNIENRK